MVTAITQGIKISVDTRYRPDHSNPANGHYVFAYHIRIDNFSENTVQLLSRQWLIFDSEGSHRQVEGDGVVGEQPIIAPGQSYSYVSGCNLHTDMGSMRGHYTMLRQNDESTFRVDIPEFQLVAPHRLN